MRGKRFVAMGLAVLMSVSPIMSSTAYAWSWPWSKKTETVAELTDDELASKVEKYFFFDSLLKSEEATEMETTLKGQDVDRVRQAIDDYVTAYNDKSHTGVTPHYAVSSVADAYTRWADMFDKTLTNKMKEYVDADERIDVLDKEIKAITDKYDGVLDLVDLGPYDIISCSQYVISLVDKRSSLNYQWSAWKVSNVVNLGFDTEFSGDNYSVILVYTDDYFEKSGAYEMDLIPIVGDYYELKTIDGFKQDLQTCMLVEDRADLKDERDDYILKSIEEYDILHGFFDKIGESKVETALREARDVAWGSEWTDITSGTKTSATSSTVTGSTTSSGYPEGVDENTPWYSDEGDFFEYPHEIIPNSDIEYISDADIYFYTPEQLRYAKNEIYARWGRKFNDKELQNWFDCQVWYIGITEPEDFDESVLSDIERHNIQVIQHRMEVNSR